MPEKFDPKVPIYTQLVERLKNAIVSGQYAPGDKIPSVRDLALHYGVNPNTLQRALAKLEDLSLLYTERTSGRYVTQDVAIINALKADVPYQLTQKYVQDMTHAGISQDQLIPYLTNHLKEDTHG